MRDHRLEDDAGDGDDALPPALRLADQQRRLTVRRPQVGPVQAGDLLTAQPAEGAEQVINRILGLASATARRRTSSGTGLGSGRFSRGSVNRDDGSSMMIPAAFAQR